MNYYEVGILGYGILNTIAIFYSMITSMSSEEYNRVQAPDMFVYANMAFITGFVFSLVWPVEIAVLISLYIAGYYFFSQIFF